jgi:hypothetical protein
MLGGAKDLFVYSRAAIERIAPHEAPHVVISITSSPDDTARIPASPPRLSVTPNARVYRILRNALG